MASLPSPEFVRQLIEDVQKGDYSILSVWTMAIWDYGEPQVYFQPNDTIDSSIQ